MATPQAVDLQTSASLVTNYLSVSSAFYKVVNVPYTLSSLGRVVYFKEASELPGPSTFSLSTTNTSFLLQTDTTATLRRNQAITLQAVSTNLWGILGGYNGLNVFSTQVLPAASAIVNPSLRSSELFVDLRSQSKTIVLPPIQTITSLANSCPFYTIKDVYGYANTNALYISSSAPDTLERSSIHNAIRITQNFAAIDLVANPSMNKWHILNYYTGSLVSRP